VCLGEPWSQMSAYSDQGEFDSSFGNFVMGTDSLSYSYDPEGGMDLGAAHPFARVGSGCAAYRNNPARGATVARRIMVELGGQWQEVEAPTDVRRWVSSEGFVVSFRYGRGINTCVSTKLPEPMPDT
jgi:hypothetical protein